MDGLRGFALLGILLVNLRGMSAPSMAFGEFSIWTGGLERSVVLLSAYLLDGAFWTLFAMLFGAGFSIMLGITGPRSRPLGLGAYYRRLLGLAIFGFLHVWLLWFGDILMIYAACGMVLPLFRHCRLKTLLVWAFALMALPLAFSILLSSAGQMADPETLAQWAAEYANTTRIWIDFLIDGYGRASFWEVARFRWEEYFYNFWYLIYLLPSALGVMLVGVALARTEGFRLSRGDDRFYRRLFRWMLVPALLGKSAYVYSIWNSGEFNLGVTIAYGIGSILGGLASAILILCLLRSLYRSGRLGWLRGGLAAAGRMALTLYLMQSLVAGLIFYGYGLGLYAQVPPQVLCFLGLLIFSGQVFFAKCWFRRFRQGPLEFLLRRLTYLILTKGHKHG